MKKMWLRVFFLSACLALANAGEAAVSAEERLEQEGLALEYQLRLARTPSDEAEERERLYLALVDECPDTGAAQEALWAVANLYLDDFDEPQEAKAQEALEYFIKKYPASPWILHVENRLIWLYEGTENGSRIPELYENMLRHDMPLSARLDVKFRCARAYENLKRFDKAEEWYSSIVKEGGSGSWPEVDAAKARLAALKKNR